MAEIDRLLGIMARLRDPERGCPWDLEQDFSSIAPYTIEEAYEVADAIARSDMEDLCDELGDLLLQVVYHAQLASEEGLFGFDDVATRISEKLIRRHPHVFGDSGSRPVEAVRRTWEETKARERAERASRRGEEPATPDPFAGIPLALPALRRAAKVQGRAERLGRVAEEATEDHPLPDARALGDLLFSAVRLARRAGVDPEQALQDATRRFVEHAGGARTDEG